MKTKFYHLLIVSAALAFSAPKANAQTLIQYWDFNATIPAGGGGGDSLGSLGGPTLALNANQYAAGLTPGHIIYSRPSKEFGSTNTVDGILDNGSGGAGVYDYSTSNDTGGTAAGNLYVRARNPSDSCTITLFIPTTGYKNIQMQFALSASSSKGENYGIFSYSTNGGSTWNKLTTAMDTFNIGKVYRPDTLQLQNPVTAASGWYPVQLNFSSDANVNNNAGFAVQIRLAGLNSFTQTSGNARFDNFAFWGTSTTNTGIDDINGEAAGYNVYPNPTTSVVNVASTKYTGAKEITIYNVVGQVVSATETKDLQTTINTSSLNSGVYFVQIKEISTGNVYTTKLVKE